MMEYELTGRGWLGDAGSHDTTLVGRPGFSVSLSSPGELTVACLHVFNTYQMIKVREVGFFVSIVPPRSLSVR